MESGRRGLAEFSRCLEVVRTWRPNFVLGKTIGAKVGGRCISAVIAAPRGILTA